LKVCSLGFFGNDRASPFCGKMGLVEKIKFSFDLTVFKVLKHIIVLSACLPPYWQVPIKINHINLCISITLLIKAKSYKECTNYLIIVVSKLMQFDEMIS
jgi:hypothetical protein